MATVTLKDVVNQQKITNEHHVSSQFLLETLRTFQIVQSSNEASVVIENGTKIDKSNNLLGQINSNLIDFIKFMKDEAFDAARRRRENLREFSPTPVAGAGAAGGDDVTPTGGDDGGDNGSSTAKKIGIATFLTGLALGAKEFVTGFFQAISDDFKKFKQRKWVQSIGGSLKGFANKIGTTFTTKFQTQINAVKDLMERGRYQFTLFKNSKELTKIKDGIRAVGRTIMSPFESLGKDLKSAGGFIKSAFTENKMWRATSEFFSKVGTSKFVEKMKGFGNVAGRIAYPVMALYQTISGAVDKMKNASDPIEATLLGLAGAGEGAFRFFLGIPELFKDVISFGAEKLGFTAFSKLLDSFDIAEDTIKGVFGFFESIGEGISKFTTPLIEGISSLNEWTNTAFLGLTAFLFDPLSILKPLMSSLWNSIKTSASEMGASLTAGFKGMIAGILPPADFAKFSIPSFSALGMTFGGGEINLNPIPESLYNWAEQPAPKTVSPPSPAGGQSKMAGLTQEESEFLAKYEAMSFAERRKMGNYDRSRARQLANKRRTAEGQDAEGLGFDPSDGSTTESRARAAEKEELSLYENAIRTAEIVDAVNAENVEKFNKPLTEEEVQQKFELFGDSYNQDVSGVSPELLRRLTTVEGRRDFYATATEEEYAQIPGYTQRAEMELSGRTGESLAYATANLREDVINAMFGRNMDVEQSIESNNDGKTTKDITISVDSFGVKKRSGTEIYTDYKDPENKNTFERFFERENELPEIDFTDPNFGKGIPAEIILDPFTDFGADIQVGDPIVPDPPLPYSLDDDWMEGVSDGSKDLTSAMERSTMEGLASASAAAPIIIQQDNSQIQGDTIVGAGGSGSSPARSPTKNNRTRASAYSSLD